MSETQINPIKKDLLRYLPSVDSLLRDHESGLIFPDMSRPRFMILLRDSISAVRQEIIEGLWNIPAESAEVSHKQDLVRGRVLEAITANLSSQRLTKLQHVINATGVVIHTNLGRAPLSERARMALVENASRYCNLEYDLVTGSRGSRGKRAIELLSAITGAEDAVVVNNCAAATMLVLSSLARNGETIVSRGELVEIGGDFRVPDVMERSGTTLREVGTTNRTRKSDYADAVNESTKVILIVHSSNFKIIGFTAKPSLSELSALAKETGVILYEDAGSGVISDIEGRIPDTEPRIVESIQAGADVVTFSGDKLMGGIQCGIIVGKRELIEKIRRNPLYRALRVDKLVYACLEATLESYGDGTETSELPVLKMLSESRDGLRSRSEGFIEKYLQEHSSDIEIVEEDSVIGGGTTPGESISSVCLSLKSDSFSANQIEERLRFGATPIITRISQDRVLIDLRTVFSDEEEVLAAAIRNVLSEKRS